MTLKTGSITMYIYASPKFPSNLRKFQKEQVQLEIEPAEEGN
jgi:hypothetical protein